MDKIFKPELSPKEILELGVFGGNYFKNNISEYPKHWFKKAKINTQKFDVNLNYFKVASGLSLKEWHEKGWITREDPIGWFQWYCRYTVGRRIPEVDHTQICRWKAYGPRHKGAILKNCAPQDLICRSRQRQGLLQWAYDPFF